uniref:V-type ATP synthase subunit F n=1 Tax=Fervidicoccus fontis TaxID=683846 RepID=A0A7J3ZIY0_9CREN
MEGKVLVIGDEETVTACRLIGCEGIVASDPDDLLLKLESNAVREDVAVILVARDLAEPVSDEINRVISRSKKIISFLPTSKSKGKPLNMRELMLRALGF